MKIYADSSFIISLIYPGDIAHAAASQFFLSQGPAEWVTCEWTEFETVNGLRQLCLAQNGPRPSVMEGFRRLFKRWHTHGNFQREEVELNEAVVECQQISAGHAAAVRMRSADVLRVAILEQVMPDLFVTRDKDQHDLALSRAFKSVLI